MNISNLLSTEQVAVKLGVSPATVLKLARNGKLAYVSINQRLFRYQPEEIERYILSHNQSARVYESPLFDEHLPLTKPEKEE